MEVKEVSEVQPQNEVFFNNYTVVFERAHVLTRGDEIIINRLDGNNPDNNRSFKGIISQISNLILTPEDKIQALVEVKGRYVTSEENQEVEQPI